MNAQLLTNLDTIDSYSDLLSGEFIEETRARGELLKRTKVEARETVELMAQDFHRLDDKVNHIGEALEGNRKSFARLEQVSTSQEKNLIALTARLRELAALLHDQAQLIKTPRAN